MPLYLDIHQLHGATSEDMAKAHTADLEAQRKYGVNYRKYWFNESCGKAFCLVEAPSAEAATRVHREAHGNVADKIIEVEPDLAEGFLGGGEVNEAGAVLLPGSGNAADPGIRTVLFTDIVNSTLLTQRLGDEKAMELIGLHDTIVRHALTAGHGREVKHTGDGIMASFVSAASAVRCALQIQSQLAQRAQDDLPLKLRIGGAAGEPVARATTTFSVRPCSWRPGSVPMRSRIRSWSQMLSLNYVLEKESPSSRSGRFRSKGSIGR